MRPGPNDRFVSSGGGVTVYRRPGGSEYALDSQGRVGNFEGTGGAGGAGGAFGLVLLILFPLGVGWVLYRTVKWAFAPEAGYRALVFIATVVASIVVIAVHVPALLIALPLPLFFMWMFSVNIEDKEPPANPIKATAAKPIAPSWAEPSGDPIPKSNDPGSLWNATFTKELQDELARQLGRQPTRQELVRIHNNDDLSRVAMDSIRKRKGRPPNALPVPKSEPWWLDPKQAQEQLSLARRGLSHKDIPLSALLASKQEFEQQQTRQHPLPNPSAFPRTTMYECQMCHWQQPGSNYCGRCNESFMKPMQQQQ
jgi:hypothetical protein